MAPMLIRAGIKQGSIDHLVRRMMKMPFVDFELVTKAIFDIELFEYRESIEIRSLIPESQWLQYELLEIEDLREQLLFDAALKSLRNIFTEKVLNHGKKKRSKPEEATGISQGISSKSTTTWPLKDVD